MWLSVQHPQSVIEQIYFVCSYTAMGQERFSEEISSVRFSGETII